MLEQVIQRAGEDPAEAALLLTLPTETAVGDRHTPLRPQAVHDALSALRAGLGEALPGMFSGDVTAPYPSGGH